jgi:hypothetical protein
MNQAASSSPTASRWREVAGVITKSEVEFRGDHFLPVVEYAYVVDGVTYKGDTIARGLITFNWKGPAARMIESFPVGATVPVYVDPKYPRQSALRPHVDKNRPVFLICFVGFVVLVILLFAFGKSQ